MGFASSFPPKTNLASSLRDKEGLVREVFQRQGVFSSAKATQPILATYGIGPCVAIIGYDEKNERGFLMHYDEVETLQREFQEENGIPTGLNKLVELSTQGISHGEKAEYEVSLTQGMHEPRFVQLIKQNLEYLSEAHSDTVSFNIVGEHIGRRFGFLHMAIDLRTGRHYKYDSHYPKPRRFSTQEILTAPFEWTIDDSCLPID